MAASLCDTVVRSCRLYVKYIIAERLDKTSLTYSASMDFEIRGPDDTMIKPPQPDPANPTTAWRWGKNAVQTRRDELTFSKDKNTGEWRVYTKTWEPTGGITPRTLLTHKDHGRNRDGTQELSSLLKPKLFSNPKPTKLLLKIIEMATPNKNEVCLDFFSGSASFAHAILIANLDDQGTRRCLSVQLQFPTSREDYPTISIIARARLRAAIATLPTEKQADAAFRAFRLAESNIRRWTGVAKQTPEAYQAQLEAFNADTLIEGWTEQGVIWEVALREGYPLTATVEQVASDAGTFWRVTDGEQERSFTLCLDNSLTLDAVRALGLAKDALFVCRDVALDPTLAANLALQCTLKVL